MESNNIVNMFLGNIWTFAQDTPGLHNKIPAQKIFARVWVAQEPVFHRQWLRFSRVWVRKDGNLVMETGCGAPSRCEDCTRLACISSARYTYIHIYTLWMCMYIYIYIYIYTHAYNCIIHWLGLPHPSARDSQRPPQKRRALHMYCAQTYNISI